MTSPTFSIDRDHARQLDAADSLAEYRQQFWMPSGSDGEPLVYLCGNSLGLQPRGVRELIDRELASWAEQAVDGHFRSGDGWYNYHRLLSEPLAEVVGALPEEVVAMNGLTANLHLLMISFYRPTAQRFKILIDSPTFPSDLYAFQSQLALHGYDAEQGIVRAPQTANGLTDEAALIELITTQGEQFALILLSGVNYFSGQFFDLAPIAAAARRAGCLIGLDLAHAVGNVPLSLHDWGIDFAAWCSYKYLNAGPGAVAGAFVHQRHCANPSLPRLAGWWGNDPDTRFQMDTQDRFVPQRGAEGWQLSNPPILAMAPLRASLALFGSATNTALRNKSSALTSYMLALIDARSPQQVTVLTPRQPERRGCQLSLRVAGDGRAFQQALQREGVVGDFRPPDVVRVAAVPLYNSFEDVWRFVDILARQLS
ncbi:MAG: kynureninase [Deltaproteobacteria bacterium]|nr:kynureninase [Deltaproteobacteria bacterium]